VVEGDGMSGNEDVWRKLFEQAPGEVRFQPSASVEHLSELESGLGCQLPGQLASLLETSNGVMAMVRVGDDLIDSDWIGWDCATVAHENEEAVAQRNGPTPGIAPPADLLLFANAGCDGIVFGLASDASVHGWWPIEGRSERLSDSLQAFLADWRSGRLCV
jgi:hypothetical protein